MAQYWLDLTRAESAILDEWTFYERDGTGSLSVADDAGTPTLLLEYGSGTSHLSAVWDAVGSVTDVDILWRAKLFAQSTFRAGLTARWATSASNFNGYSFSQYTVSRAGMRLHSDDTGSSSSLLGSRYDTTNAEYYWGRYKISGTSHYAKYWQGALGDEPASWERTATDATHASGAIGMYQRGRSADPSYVQVSFLAVGTGTDEPPTGPVGESEPEPLLWLPSQFRRMAIAGAAASGGSHSTTGAASVQQPVASAGASSQTHATAGAASIVAAVASAGASSHTHITTGQASIAQPVAAAGTSSVSHATTGAASVAQPIAAAGASAHTHATAGAASVVQPVAASGTSQVGDTHSTTGAASILRAVAASATSSQQHITIGPASTLQAVASSGTSAQQHATAGAASAVQSVASSGTSQTDNTHATVGAASAMQATAAAGASTQTHITAGAASVIASRASAGRSSDGTNADLRKSVFVQVPVDRGVFALVSTERGVFVRVADSGKTVRSG